MNRVVIIDDEIQSRNGIAEIFRNHSPQWEIGGLFEDGSQALEYLLQHPEINLIVTDIRMPKFDGLELISRIRQYNKLIPIIIISGYSEFSYAKKAVDYQVFRYIVKPILPSEFDAVITSVENFFRLEDDPFNEYNLTSSEFDQFLDLLFSESVSLNKSQTIHILEKQCGFSFQGAWFLLIAGNHEFNNHIDDHRALIQNFASEISPEHHVFLFHEKIYCIILQKTDIDYDAFKRHMQKFIWKFSSDLFVHTGIYHSCNNDTLKNAFFSAQKNCLSIPTKKYMRSVLTLDTLNPNILLSGSIRSLVLPQRNTGRSIRNNSRDIIFSNENNIPFSISIKYFCQLMGIHTLIWFNPRLPQL